MVVRLLTVRDWAPLKDVRLFNKMRVTDYGRVIEWPEPNQGPDWPQVDIDADGLGRRTSSSRPSRFPA